MVYFLYFLITGFCNLFPNDRFKIISLLIADEFCIAKTHNHARGTVQIESFSTRKFLSKHF